MGLMYAGVVDCVSAFASRLSFVKSCTPRVVKPKPIHVLDRIGGGDGFVGGLLYAILKGWNSKKWIQFGWASGAFTTTFLTDYAQPADEEQIWSVWEGNARVKR